MNREQLISAYLDWVNNFLSVEAFAQHYGLHDFEAELLINLGRQCFVAPHPEA